MLDRVSGPFRGYYVAVYACEMGDVGKEYLGYFKICMVEPASYWEADCLIKGCDANVCDTAEAAMQRAEQLARDQAGNLPSRLPWSRTSVEPTVAAPAVRGGYAAIVLP